MIRLSESLAQYGFTDGQDFDPRTNMKHILDKPFKLKAIRDTPFSGEKYDPVPNAVTITTKDDYDVDGGTFHEFFVTWKVVTDKLKNAKLREDLSNGVEVPALKLVSKPSKKRPGNNYYDLVPA